MRVAAYAVPKISIAPPETARVAAVLVRIPVAGNGHALIAIRVRAPVHGGPA